MDPEQKDVLNQFREITQFGDDEEDKVMRLLRVTNWNLAMALSRYFEGDFPSLVDSPADLEPAPVAPIQEFHFDRSAALIDHLDLLPKLPKAIQIPNQWKLSAGVASLGQQHQPVRRSPLLFALLLVPRLLVFLSLTLGGLFQRLVSRLLGLTAPPNALRQSPQYHSYADPEKDTVSTGPYTSFKDYLDSLLGETSDLPVFQGEFNEAFNTAKAEIKWLLVVLIDSECEDSVRFAKKYLNNANLIEFIKERDVLLWCGDVAYAEAHEVARTYRVPFLPFSMLIANASATGQTMPLMSTIARIQTFKDEPKRLVRKLGKLVDKFEPQLVAQRYDKQETELSRLIRQQQDEAYEQSLLKDKQRSAEKREKEALIKREELRKEQKDVYLKLSAIKLIEREEPEWVKGEYTRIQIRNNEGLRILQNFGKSETLYDIYKFVTVKLYIEESLKTLEVKTPEELVALFEADLATKDISLADGYEHQFEFELISPFPKYNLAPEKVAVSEVKAIWPNGSILVETLDEDDD